MVILDPTLLAFKGPPKTWDELLSPKDSPIIKGWLPDTPPLTNM